MKKIFPLTLIFSLAVACLAQNLNFPVSLIGAPLPSVTAQPSDNLSLVASNTATYTRIALLPGTYNVTNAIRLREGQSLVGSGFGNTFLKFWGYTVDATQTVGDYWVAVLLNTNVYVADLDIRCMFASNNVFQACVGFPAGAGGGNFGGTNFLVERVSMHGDTDNYYVDNGGFWVGSIKDCNFDSHWDTFVQQGKENSIVHLINPFMRTKGPDTSKNNASSRPCALRIVGSGGATNRQFNVYGGYIYTAAQVCLNQGFKVAFYGTRFVSETNGFLCYQSDDLAFHGVQGIAYGRITSLTGGQANYAVTISPAVPQDSAGEEASFGDSPAGSSYWNTNLGAWRVYDGLAWGSALQRGATNQLMVTGDGTAAYNGIYTLKAGALGTSFFSYTNFAGKFLVGSTNSQADAPFAISDTESISNGLEHVINGSGLFERGWDTPAIRVRYLQGPPGDFLIDTDRAYGVTNGYYVCRSEKALTKSSATTLFNVTLATNKTLALRVFATTRCNNGTDYQVIADNFLVTAVSKAGVITANVSTVSPSQTSLSTGTFTDTWTAVANGASLDIKCNAVPSLTPGTLSCHWRVEVDSDHAVILTP
jgi:hypothetical protein